MNHLFKTVLLLASILIGTTTYAQTNKEKALLKGKEAMRLEEEKGDIDGAIKLFSEAQKLDPENFDYPYEIAFAYTAKKEHKKASIILEKLLTHKNASDLLYQALGNSYDFQGKPDLAIQTYEKGLKKFPKSGRLYLELGNMQVIKKEYNKALDYFEKGIELDPKFPSNYYWASKLFCSSEDEVWGMIYGEIFMNLETNTKRTAEISKMLFDTYKSEIKFSSPTTASVSFCSNIMFINAEELKDTTNFKMPFGTFIYENTLMLSIIGEKDIDVNSLDRIRKQFVKLYFTLKHNEKYPNVLYDYQQKIFEQGHLEAYNHWILMKGDEDGFDKWKSNNKQKWDSFVKWISENHLELSETNKFYRAQY